MIFDDHDITDDFFLNPIWRDRVLDHARSARRSCTTGCSPTPCSRTGATTPCATTSGPHGRAAAPGAPQLFPAGATDGPGPSRRSSASTVLFGHDLRNDADGRRQLRRVNPPMQWHFGIDGPEAPGRRPRQPHAAQLRLPARPARQRVGRRARRPDPGAAAARRAARCSSWSRPLQVDRAARPRRPRRPADLPDLRPGRRHQGPRTSPCSSPSGPAPDDRHQPRRHRGVGVRRRRRFEHLLERLEPVPPGRAAVRRRALLGGHRDELLARRRDPAGALRAVHVERLQERDAGAWSPRSTAAPASPSS